MLLPFDVPDRDGHPQGRDLLAARHRQQTAELRVHVAERSRAAGAATDPDLAAAALPALVDELAVHVMARAGHDAVAILDAPRPACP